MKFTRRLGPVATVGLLLALTGASLAQVPRQVGDDYDWFTYLPLIHRSQASPHVAGCAVFPPDNVWNIPVDTLPVDANSDAYVAVIGAGAHVHADFGSGTWEGGPIGIPYVDVPGAQPFVDVTFDYADESDPGPYPIPPDAPVEGGPESTGDRHVLVVDRDTCTLYELYDAFPQPDGTWHAGSGAVFDLSSHALRPAGWTSADAAGLPILPGLARYDEVAAGEIRHALRFTSNSTRRAYVWPARHFAPYHEEPNSPPMGQRFRLRAGFDISGFSPEVQVILQALKTYGMILADNGSSWYISGAPDPRWDNDALHELHQVKGSDFDAVDVSSLMVDPDSGQVGGAPYPVFSSDLQPTGVLTFTAVATTHLPIVLSDSPPGSNPMSLAEVAYWAYQLQGISEPGAVDALVASRYDMLVLEPTRTDWSSDDRYFDTRGMVARLKGSPAGDGAPSEWVASLPFISKWPFRSDGVHRKVILAYVDIGEAEDWRWYWDWSKDWDCVGAPPTDWPDYILACDPDGWSGNYPVAYWDEDWKDIVIYGENQGNHPDRDYTSAIDEAILDGFDGIYLDWVEGYENTDVIAAAQAEGLDPAVEMIAFIQEMRAYATARDPDFLIVQQNAAALIDGHPELLTVIDAIAQEAIWYDGDATDDWHDPDGYDWINDADLTDYYVGYLDRYLDADVPVFNCEYALEHAATAYANAYAEGYVPYVTRRSLSQLTTTPPPGYPIPYAMASESLYNSGTLNRAGTATGKGGGRMK